MNVQKINQVIREFRKELMSRDDDEWLSLYEVIFNWKSHWNIDAMKFGDMYEKSLTGNHWLWEGKDYHPKDMVVRYAAMNDDLTRSAFIDLLDENRDISGRVHRFLFLLNELKNNYQSKNYLYDTHYHDNRNAVLLYLSCEYPDIYTFYHKSGFEVFLKLVDAKSITDSHDIERYVKVTKTANVFLNKDAELQEYVNQKLSSSTSLIGQIPGNRILVFLLFQYASSLK